MAAIDHRMATTGFRLQTMQSIFEESQGQSDTIHRHNYYTVLLVEKAFGKHIIDYTEYDLGEKEVHFVSPGQPHQVISPKKPIGRVITFSRDFLIQNNIAESFITNINLFQNFGLAPPLKLDTLIYKKLIEVIADMESCLSDTHTYKDIALGALLQLFLIYCNNSSKLDLTQTDEVNPGICILRDFKNLIENKYTKWHKVKEYATEIHITPKYLNQTVKSITGKVAKAHIQDRLLLEAKRLLLHTNLSIKEIAYEIGFEEPLHFSAFFKKKNGNSPSAFRNQIKKSPISHDVK